MGCDLLTLRSRVTQEVNLGREKEIDSTQVPGMPPSGGKLLPITSQHVRNLRKISKT